jgi:Domain of unknown function (DUF5615)
MLRLASDADVKGPIIKGLFKREPGLDLVRVQDVGLRTAPDPDVLEWAAGEGRTLITHDCNTMTGYAYDRVRAGQPMPGVFVVSGKRPYGPTIDEILIVNGCSTQTEWIDRVEFLPL